MSRNIDTELAAALTTPFQTHLDHCQRLAPSSQLVECADYIQNAQLLVMEFLESYYLVEQHWQPESRLVRQSAGADKSEELVLEPFYESLELEIVDRQRASVERLVCLSGAISPVPDAQHPALSRRALDFVGLRDGQPGRIVFGVVQSSKDDTVFLLLLRALNALAELLPPMRVLQLGREIVRGGIPEDARFTLQLGLSEPDARADVAALCELTRDLAEAFKREAAAVAQLSGMLEAVSCVDVSPRALEERKLERHWEV
jgi:hypothetical protein